MNAPILRKTFSGRGRPRRQNVSRYNDGQVARGYHLPKEETPEQAMATVMKARIRVLGASKDNADNPLWGTAIGRLVIAGVIEAKMLPVAQRYGRLKAITGMMHDVRPAYGVPVIARLSCIFGRDPYDRIDPEQAWDETELRKRHALIARIKQDDADITTAMWEMEGRRESAGAARILNRVVMWDDADAALGASDQSLLRQALNRLDRMWTMQKGH